MSFNILTKLRAINVFIRNIPIMYRDNYSSFYPHGIVKKVVKKYPKYKNIEVFVETGTFKGKTTQVESHYFREVYTIELNKTLYEENLSKFKASCPNVKAYYGDSGKVMPDILKTIDEPCVIFLDAHWSGNKKTKWDQSKWKGYAVETSYRGDKWPPTSEQQCPLIDEVTAIRTHMKHRCLLIIDDWSVAGTQNAAFDGEDWRSISLDKIIDALGKDNIVDYFTMAYKDKVRMIMLLS